MTNTSFRNFGAAVFAGFALFVTVFVPAVSAQDYVSTGSATWSDATPGVGESVTISGNTTPDTMVTVTVQSGDSASATNGAAVLGLTTLGSTMSDSNGDYSLTVTMPSGISGNVVLAVNAGGEVISSTSYSLGSGAASGGNAAAQTSGSNLPVTGSASNMFMLTAAVLVASGGLLLVLARRFGRA